VNESVQLDVRLKMKCFAEMVTTPVFSNHQTVLQRVVLVRRMAVVLIGCQLPDLFNQRCLKLQLCSFL